MKKVLIIDNYDSFTYNLVHYFESLDCDVTVLRNDEFEIDEVVDFQNIVLSPGPGIPSEAGLLKQVIATYSSTKKILGICLGQQAIAEVFGCTLLNLEQPFHGIATEITIIENDSLFNNLPNKIEVGRYHSWVINPIQFSENLIITSLSETGEIMSIRHKIYDVKAVQFHPESILTPHGKTILSNWLNS